MKESITEYLDYRDYLHDFYKEKRAESSYFSYRFIASKVAVDASHIAKIFLKKRHVPDTAVNAFVELCKFNKRDAECFKLMVKFNKAKTDKEAKQWYECLLSLKDVDVYKVQKKQYDFFSKWYNSAILVLLGSYDFSDDYSWLSKKMSPEISVHEAKQAIKLLESLKLIAIEKSGLYKPTNNFFTTGEITRQIAVQNYQHETIKMAGESIRRHTKNQRDISTVTLSIPQKELSAVGEIIKEFRQTLLRYSEEAENTDSVFQLNVQLYPLTNLEKS